MPMKNETKRAYWLGNEERTLFIHKYMPVEELSKLNNIFWALEVNIETRISMILLAGNTKSVSQYCYKIFWALEVKVETRITMILSAV